MHLTFSSTNARRLMNLVVAIEKYTSKYKTCQSKRVYNEDLMNFINANYRKVPDNIGTLHFTDKKDKGNCMLCTKKIESCTMRKLSCGHNYHKKCIDNWLLDHKYHCYKCCRSQI
jgi:hypothetical protein